MGEQLLHGGGVERYQSRAGGVKGAEGVEWGRKVRA